MAVDRSSLDCAVIHTCVGFGGEKKRGRGVVALMQDFNPSIHMTDSDFAIFTQASCSICPLLPARQKLSLSINIIHSIARLSLQSVYARCSSSSVLSFCVSRSISPFSPNIPLSRSPSLSSSRSPALSLYLSIDQSILCDEIKENDCDEIKENGEREKVSI